jgi:hypothetical protein
MPDKTAQRNHGSQPETKAGASEPGSYQADQNEPAAASDMA